jgi:hypothetical protein
MSEVESTFAEAPVVATPAPTPVVETTPAPDSTAEQEATPEGESPEATPEKTLTQSEVNKIIQKEKAQASRRAEKQVELRLRAEYAEKEAAALRNQLNPPKPQLSGEPVPAQFQDYESYISALTDWKVEQKFGGIQKQNETQQAQRAVQERAATILPKLKPAMEKYDDFNEVATSYSAPPAVQAAMLRSSMVGELYYHLGQNPDELDRISRLDDIEQVYAVRDLEAKLKGTPSPTKTPAPIVPNSGRSAVSKSPSAMNYDEFAEYRRKRLANRR